MAPNGLNADLAGPFEGRRHDASLLRESQLLERIEPVPGLRYYCLYGDPAYPTLSLDHILLQSKKLLTRPRPVYDSVWNGALVKFYDISVLLISKRT